jgi:GNAT superfamily N-acetyltransferase
MIEIRKIVLPVPGLERLHAEACAEGFDFLDTLIEDWASGANRFDLPGEQLCGCLEDGELIAVGGLNIDPFINDPQIGRIRRVYVRPAWRNKGIGRQLMNALIEAARPHFHIVRLRAESPDAARLYERLGFLPIDNPDASHSMIFRQ